MAPLTLSCSFVAPFLSSASRVLGGHPRVQGSEPGSLRSSESVCRCQRCTSKSGRGEKALRPVAELHRYMIAVFRVVVNHDGRGGTAPDPVVKVEGGQVQANKHVRVVVGGAVLPHGSVTVSPVPLPRMLANGIVACFCSFLCFCVPSFGWRVVSDMTKCGVSHVEQLVMFGQWVSATVTSRAGRPLLYPPHLGVRYRYSAWRSVYWKHATSGGELSWWFEEVSPLFQLFLWRAW